MGRLSTEALTGQSPHLLLLFLHPVQFAPVFVARTEVNTSTPELSERWEEGSEKMEAGRKEGKKKDGRKHESSSNLADSWCSSYSNHMMAA